MAANETTNLTGAISDNQTALAKLYNTLLGVTVFQTTGDILSNMHNVLSNIVWYRIGSWFYLGISIASICVGALYKDLCTVEHMIPIYLMVAGSVGLATNLLFLTKWATGSWATWTKCSPGNDACKSFWFSWTLWLLWWFQLAWFIAGSVWIFGVHATYSHNYYYEPDTHLLVVRHYHSPGNLVLPMVVSDAAEKAMIKAHAKTKGGIALDDMDSLVHGGGAVKTKMVGKEKNSADGHANVGEANRVSKDIVSINHDLSGNRLSNEHRITVGETGEDDERDDFGAGKEALVRRDSGTSVFDGVNFAAVRARGAAAILRTPKAHQIRRMAMPKHPYCHRGMYEYAFWITIVEYIFLALEILVFLSLSCCSCCAFLVVPYTGSNVPTTAQ